MMRRGKTIGKMAAGTIIATAVFSLAQAAAQESYSGRFGVFAAQPPALVSPAQTQSTHPAMTPMALAAARANFPHCIESLWPQAARRHISRRTFDAQTRGLEPDMKIMELLDKQPEFSRPVWEYLDGLVSEDRIKAGRAIIAQNRAVFDAVERAYGVDRYVLTAIWGIESNFGPEGGERSVVQSTATLACIGRRQNYFRDEFLTALEIIDRGDVPAELMKGSWAGAFGPTQFMPTAFKRYAVDFDGDGRKNVVQSIPDLLASTANNLKKDGWQSGASWGYEVTLPPNFNFMLTGRKIRHPVHYWEALGVHRVNGSHFPRRDDVASILTPAGANGPAFLIINNFRTIMRYNPSESYALAIGHLADRIRGGSPFVRPWPREEQPLSRTERIELQQRLAARGYDLGDTDGHLGPKTRIAIRDLQARAGMVPDGFVSVRFMDWLRRN
jgi:lytic murein transglycosylase